MFGEKVFGVSPTDPFQHEPTITRLDSFSFKLIIQPAHFATSSQPKKKVKY